MALQPLKRHVYDALISRAWSDEAFSRFLDENPKAAIAEMGQRFDDVGALRVLRDTPDVRYLLIPDTTSEVSARGETNEGELDVTRKSGREAPMKDEAFLAKLESNPRAALAGVGQSVPDNIELVVVRDSQSLRHVHIPLAPSTEGEVSDEELLKVQGGFPWISATFAGTAVSWVVTLTVQTGGTFD